MSNIIQSVSITKHINPSKQVSDEYTLMITYRDVVYTSKIKQESFSSVLFEFDMLEQLIYNSNHKQKVGDVYCDMEIKESEAFGKVLDVKLLFERDVKPMKKIIEEHPFQLQEKKLDYDDKIGLAMTNLRSEINFVEIKPTTKIVKIAGNIGNSCTYNPTINEEIKVQLNNNYVDNIKVLSPLCVQFQSPTFITHFTNFNIYIFIDQTKKPNNRKIKFYKSIDEFEQSREQFKSYHILDMKSHGILIEEIA